jgi:hypothetical protein
MEEEEGGKVIIHHIRHRLKAKAGQGGTEDTEYLLIL